MLKLYVTPYRERVDARNDLGSAMVNAADAVALVALQEKTICALLEQLRRERDVLVAVRRMEAEAARRYVEAADRYREVHTKAVPWSEMASDYEQAEAAE